MSTKRYTGGAPKVQQVTGYLFAGTWAADETVTVTVGSKAVTTTTGSTTIATIIDTLVTALAALDADLYPEFAEFTPTRSTSTLVFTVTETHAGKPITCTVSTNSALGTIGGASSSTGTVSTANSGPFDVGVAANYSDAALPANGDTLWIDSPDVELRYTLEALTAITTLTIHAPTDAPIGLPPINQDATPYPEYRPRYFKVAGATLVNIGNRDGSGSNRVMMDFGSALAAAVNVFGSGTGEDEGRYAVALKGTNAANVFNVSGGEVEIAPLGGETSTVGTLTQLGGTLRCGLGVTFTVGTKHGGTLELNGTVGTSLTNFGGDVTLNGTGTVAQLTARGAGTVSYNTTGALGGTTEVSEGATLTFDNDSRTKTVTNPIEVYNGGQVIDTNQVVSSVAQVNTYLFGGTWEATDEVKVDLFGSSNTFVVGSTSITTIIDTIVTAWLLLSGQFAKLTPSRSSNSLVLTAKSGNAPFMCLLTPMDTGATAADDQRIEGGVVPTLGTVGTAASGLVLDFNEMAGPAGMGKMIRVSRQGVA
jgi:hypothetical protein